MTSLATNGLSIGEAPETQPNDDRRPGRPGKAPTIYDVARSAGVSHQTVSRVLNDRPGVSLRTRSAVLEAISTTGFVANAAARGLRSSCVKDWGLLLIGPPDPSSWPLVVGLTSGVTNSGGAVTLQAVDADDRAATESAIRKFLSSRIRGFVVVRGSEVTRFLCGP